MNTLPCPFCGCVKIDVQEIEEAMHHVYWEARCAQCGAVGPDAMCSQAEDVIAGWNLRVAHQPAATPVMDIQKSTVSKSTDMHQGDVDAVRAARAALAGGAEPTRSQQRRIAAQRGELQPEFDGGAEAKPGIVEQALKIHGQWPRAESPAMLKLAQMDRDLFGAESPASEGRFKLTCDDCGEPVHPQWPQAHKCPECDGTRHLHNGPTRVDCDVCEATGVVPPQHSAGAPAGDALAVLRELVACPYVIDEATVPAAGIDAAPEQVVGALSVALPRMRKARAIVRAADQPGATHDECGDPTCPWCDPNRGDKLLADQTEARRCVRCGAFHLGGTTCEATP